MSHTVPLSSNHFKTQRTTKSEIGSETQTLLTFELAFQFPGQKDTRIFIALDFDFLPCNSY